MQRDLAQLPGGAECHRARSAHRLKMAPPPADGALRRHGPRRLQSEALAAMSTAWCPRVEQLNTWVCEVCVLGGEQGVGVTVMQYEMAPAAFDNLFSPNTELLLQKQQKCAAQTTGDELLLWL